MKYNLTMHKCDHQEVETLPRLGVIQNPKNALEVIDKVKRAISDVPKGGDVVIGGHPQYVGVLIQLAKTMRWTVWYYSTYDNEIYTAAFLSRQDRYEIELQ